MKKKVIALLTVLVLVLAASAAFMVTTVAGSLKEDEQEKELKAGKEKSVIEDLFHDQGYIYMTPDEPKQDETVTLRLRTARYNVTRAQIQYTTDKGRSWKTADMKLEKQDDTGYYDIWKGEIPAEGNLLYYRFTAGNSDLLNTVYYDTKGITAIENGYSTCWQIVPGHDVPDWAKGALWYSVMPDAFYNGNTTNDKNTSGEHTYVSWNSVHKSQVDKYGGDLAGIESKLDYIAALGADAVYMNPISKTWHNAGYAPLRYDEVDSTFGNEEALKQLSDAIHDRDMKLMGDVVLTFANEDSYYFNKDGRWPVTGAYQSEESEWYSLFKFFRWPDNFMQTWSSPAIDLNQQASKNLFYAQQNSYLLKYAGIFDGYRFDCGGWLWGTTETDDLSAYTFVKEIRDALKAENEDFYILSEADWGNLNTDTWDSQWNISYMPKLQDYAKGLINETLMLEAMYTYEKTIPRNVALCLQNMMSDHDSNRVVQHDDYMYNAAALIQMTYLGSPSIFYGEEVDLIRENEEGIGTTQPFYAMEWDESNWDQARLNFYKATAELRKKFTCVKTGVVNILDSDIANNMICFGRWDKNGAAITVTSQNSEMITVEIPVNKCDIKNGTVMTDWYTGAQYVVEDGKITADIIPGGTVLVTGKESSVYRQVYEQSSLGSVSAKNNIVTADTASFAITGTGRIDNTKDTMTYVNTAAYDDFSVFANVKGKGKGTLMIRNSADRDAVYYAAVIDGDTLSIMARTEAGEKPETLVSLECTKNTYVKLLRTGNNEFTAYKTEVKDGSLGTWELIEGASVSLNMGNKVLYGFAPLKGEMKINNVTFEQLAERSTFDTFDEKVNTALFDNVGAEFVTLKDGRLTITNSKKVKLHSLLTNAMDNDWTFKAKVGSIAADMEYAGVVCSQDQNNYIVAGRREINGKQQLFIGKAVNGVIAVYGSVEDPLPDEDVIVQLQRIGAYYSAVYSADDGATWQYIGRLYTNYSNERVGILAAGEGSVSYDWVSFGDSINDGVSTNTPHTPVAVDTTYTNNSTADECEYDFLTGDWSLVTGGWTQKDKEVFAQASAVNKLFSGLYAEATVEIKDGSGFAGLAFGKTTPYTDAEDGFVLQYYKTGKLVLTCQGKTIAERELKTGKEDSVRLVVEAFDGRIIVYAGQAATPVMSLSNTGYYNGYVAFCTKDAKADFRNFYHGSTNASWNWVASSGAGSGSTVTTAYSTYGQWELHGISTLSGYAFTNFVCTAKLMVSPVDEDMATASGLLLCASEGKSATTDGVFVYMSADGRLVLEADGVEKASYDLPEASTSAFIMVVKQNGAYKVFLKGVDTSVLEYSEDFNRGGVLSVYTINGRGTFTNIAIENLQPEQDYARSALAAKWNDSEINIFTDDYSTSDSIENYHLYWTDYGTYKVQDGVLSCTDSNAWIAGATIMEDIYSDFAMEFKLRVDTDGTGWMSVGMRKDKVDGNHNDSGFSFMVQPDGTVYFFGSEEQENIGAYRIANFSAGEWYDVKIVAVGSSVTAYINGTRVASYTDDRYKEGFISFTSGMTEFSIDDLKITPMN